MKIIRLFAICSMIMLAFASCDNSSSESGQTGTAVDDGMPKAKIALIPGQSSDLQFSHIDMQFADVVAGDSVKAVYPFQNMSNHSVKIDEVKVSCYCLSAEYPTHNLAPGEVGEIKVTFRTKGQARAVPATHEKMFPILINGDMMPMETLKLRGRVMPNPADQPS